MSKGTIVQVIGAVVDTEFSRDAMPKVFDALTVDDTDIMLEVQQQLGDGVVRSIALGSTDGLKRGLPVTNTGAPISGRTPRASTPSASLPTGCPRRSPAPTFRSSWARTSASARRWR